MSNDPGPTGLDCFLDFARPCGPSCMAYLNEVPRGQEYQDQQFSRCSLLVNIHKVAKHSVIIAKELSDLSTGLTQVPPPPPPRTL